MDHDGEELKEIVQHTESIIHVESRARECSWATHPEFVPRCLFLVHGFSRSFCLRSVNHSGSLARDSQFASSTPWRNAGEREERLA